jgi:hypothetical protein
MQKLCIYGTMTAFSYGGWYLGAQFGEFMTSLVISGIASLLGVFVGWRIWKRFFEF